MGKIVGLIFPEKEEGFSCPICGKEYKTAKGLESHMEKEHQDGK